MLNINIYFMVGYSFYIPIVFFAVQSVKGFTSGVDREPILKDEKPKVLL